MRARRLRKEDSTALVAWSQLTCPAHTVVDNKRSDLKVETDK